MNVLDCYVKSHLAQVGTNAWAPFWVVRFSGLSLVSMV